MKGLTLISIALLTFAGVVSIVESAELGLVGAWLFNEGSGKTVKDAVGGNDGEIKGSVSWEASGKFEGALKFPGKGDSYVSIPYKDVFDSDPYTFTAWVKLESASWQYIVWQNGLVWPEPDLKRHLDIWIHDGSNIAVLMWHLEGGGQGRVDGKTAVADGKWHHVAKVSDSKSMKLYIDGNLDAEEPMGGKLIVNGEDPLWIGARPGNVAATGLFDEIGFFAKALSGSNLKNVMDEGLESFAPVSMKEKVATVWGKVKSE